MKIKQFVETLQAYATEVGVNQSDPTAQRRISDLMEAVGTAVTTSTTESLRPPDGVSVPDDFEIDAEIAAQALETIDAMLREERAGLTFTTILDVSEGKLYMELLRAFEIHRDDTYGVYEYVNQRRTLFTVSASSPLYGFIQCILRKQFNYTEAIEQELADAQITDRVEPVYPKGIGQLMGKYRELLLSCE